MAAAVAMAKTALAYLAVADVASVSVATQGECLRGLAQIESLHLVARSVAVTAFSYSGGYEADGQYSARTWLRWQTRATGGAAGLAVGWARRLEAHPAVAVALTAGQVSVSYAKAICDWTDQIPEEYRADADQILLDAAAGGADLADLAGLAEEMARRTAHPDTDDGDGGFRDRSVRLVGLFGGRGSLDGDLTPECHATVEAALGALSKRNGPEDLRTPGQRKHDALEEICRRAIATGTLPDRAGQPTQAQVHMTLDQLRGLPGAADAEQAWMAARAAGAGEPGWLIDPAAVEAYTCDAHLATIVTGHVDRVVLALAVRKFMSAARATMNAAQPGSHPAGQCPVQDCDPGPGTSGDCDGQGPPMTFNELQDLFLRQAVEILSGPAGLAAHLRTSLAGPAAGGVGLPLDVGAVTSTIPSHLRRAVIKRDRHCAFPGCGQPPAVCQVHHLIPRSQGGTTSLTNMVLLCAFHHLIMIHRWGWTLALNGDGTTTATTPDGQRTFRSHSPPTASAVG